MKKYTRPEMEISGLKTERFANISVGREDPDYGDYGELFPDEE